MGSPCVLHLYAAEAGAAGEVARAATGEVRRLEHKYSRYRDDSITAAINASAGREAGGVVDEETASLLDYAHTAWAQSDGLFDISAGVLRRAWDFKSGRLPAPREVEAARSLVGWERVRWERPRLALPVAGMELDFGGFVKEYAADRVAELCRQRGLRHGLVDLGGDLAVVGPHPDGSPWITGVRDPRQPQHALATLRLSSGGLASSGDYERCMWVDGQRYGHILNPRTGWPVRGLASVSVAASHCLVAGSASTIAMLKEGREALGWLDALGLPNLRIDQSNRVSGTLRERGVAAGVSAASP
ncbi:MAG: FAD:protein FMN transferase [Deltaproteobacteria bacterium]|nr:FAD:protein FMN transferase [Deltaproteobacteria bacterium]MBW2417350.1 FAD:protein FMN transferase [Deltaproteobacteria bacterium]